MFSLIHFCVGLIMIVAGSARRARIIGGTNAFIEDCPFLASLRRIADNEHMCSGAIIGHRYILTAAHCLHESYATFSNLRIVVGATDPSETEGESYLPQRYFTVPSYDSNQMGQVNHQLDIAVIKTYSYIQFNEYIKKIDLPTRIVLERDLGIIFGWGATTYPSNLASDILQKTWMTVVNDDHCKNIVPFHIYYDQFCAYQKKNVGPCIGDGGNPMVSQDDKLIGILTVSLPCATGIPDLYTSVYVHLDFIQSIIKSE